MNEKKLKNLLDRIERELNADSEYCDYGFRSMYALQELLEILLKKDE